MIKLHIVPVQGEPFEHPIEEDSLVLGRASSADLVLEDRFLSRNHSRIFRDGDRYLIEDLGSRNGTLLNGQRVHGPQPIVPGDVIKISGSVISIVGSGGAVTPAPRPEPSSSFGDHTIFRSASGMLESQIAADSQQIQGEEALRRYAERLNLVNEVHRALGQSMELEELLELILERVFDHLRPEQGAIYLKHDDGDLDRAASRSLPGVDAETFYSRSLVREVTEKGVAALVFDIESDERFAAAQSILSSGVRSLVAAPLLDDKGTLGMIVLSSRAGVRQFSEGDMELLVSLASIAALRLRNVALLEEAAERRRLEKELALGRQIQETLLPEHLPEIPGYALHAGNIPSRGVSGDYYQVLLRDGDRECVLMVGDVSGKGIAASLLTFSLEALSAVPIEDGLPPEEICARLSRLLFSRTPPEKYATAFLAILEPETGTVRYTNAGHNPGLVVRASGEVEHLGPTGMPIGLIPDGVFEAGESSLGAGDTLILYTDGITEAADPDEEEYGLERLVRVCARHRDADLPGLSAAIANDLDDFVRGEPFPDDRTLVMTRRLAE
ncbi:MAG: SpoIIE family protein phosphatase [bacterium]|nr:SpoIIE family protein phosphatase [bacterium]